MHGLGDSAEGFAPLFQQHSDILPNCKYVLLTAPTRAVTLNMGMRMTSWYDIRTLGAREMNEEVLDSAEIISRVLQEESKSCENVYLGGFS